MKLLVYGHQSHTGFGVVTREIGERLVAAGVDVRIVAVNHRGEPVRGGLIGRVWPAQIFGDAYGGNWSSAAIEGSAWRKLDPNDDWRPDMVLIVSDMSGAMSHVGRQGLTEQWRSVPVLHYCPIEGDDLPPGWRTFWEVIQPVAMSDYGARVISEHIGRPVERIYHGVDTATFRPVAFNDPLHVAGRTLRTKEDCKAAFGLDPARKVILRTDRNVTRKFYPALFAMFREVARRDPDVDLVLHCHPLDTEGSNLYEELARYPEELRGRLRWTDAHDTFNGLPTEGLVALMNAADVYVSTTGGEGFGLTLAESLACEVPVVVTDWAADRETVGSGGVLVAPLTDVYGQQVRYHSTYGMDWAVPDPRGFVEPVLDLLAHPHRRKALGRAGRMHVTRSFSWDAAAASFHSLLTDALALAA